MVSYIVLGLVESTIAIRGSDPIVFFWFPALCGGGALVLSARGRPRGARSSPSLSALAGANIQYFDVLGLHVIR